MHAITSTCNYKHMQDQPDISSQLNTAEDDEHDRFNNGKLAGRRAFFGIYSICAIFAPCVGLAFASSFEGDILLFVCVVLFLMCSLLMIYFDLLKHITT